MPTVSLPKSEREPIDLVIDSGAGIKTKSPAGSCLDVEGPKMPFRMLCLRLFTENSPSTGRSSGRHPLTTPTQASIAAQYIAGAVESGKREQRNL